MEFGLAIISNLEQEKTDLITKFSDELNLAFKDKNYGIDVKAYTIGIICVAPQFKQFFKPKKPKYIKGKKEINPDGIPIILEDNLEYDIILDFETFRSGAEEVCRKLLAEEILKSLIILDDMKAKMKNFNSEIFKADLRNYFKEKELI